MKLLSAATLLLALPLAAQPVTGALRVHVVSSTSGERVPRATVALERPNGTVARRANANDAGSVTFVGLAPGAWTASARALGYRPARATRDVSARDTADVELRLDPAPQTLAAVRAEGQATAREQFARTPDVGAITLSGRAMRDVPSIGEPDVLRAAQLLAGVVARNDYTAGYNVRGGESDQNLVLLDGIPVYNPFHLGGLFGTFIDQAVGSVDMLVGGFPAEYGTRLSSVLDVHTREQDRGGVHGTVGVSLLTSSVTLGGTVDSARGSWNVAARRTYIDKVVGALTDKTLPYHFQDAQGGGSWRTRGGGTLSLTTYAGEDRLGGSFADFGDSMRAGGGGFLFRWGNTLGGLTFRQPLGTSRVLGDSAALVQRVSLTAFSTLLDLGAGSIRFRDDLREAQAAGQLLSYHARHTARVGYEASTIGIAYDVTSSGETAELFRLRQRPTALSLYVDDVWKPNDRLLARLGLRAEAVSGAHWGGISPRASLRWFATPDLAFTVAAGRYAQWVHALRNEDVPVRIFDFWVASDRYTPVSTATHLVGGVERWFGPRAFVRVEGYAKRYHDLLEPNAADDPAVRGDEFTVLHGHSYGADVLLRRLESGRFSGWLAYGYGVSGRTSDDAGSGSSVLNESTGSYWPAQDRRHNLNAVGSWRAGRNYVIGARFGYGSGTPFTDVTGQIVRRLYDGAHNTWDTGVSRRSPEPIGGPRNAVRYPPFHRLDLGVSRAFAHGATTWTPSLQLINAYNRQNTFVYAFDYTSNPPTRKAISQFPLLPSVGLTVEF